MPHPRKVDLFPEDLKLWLKEELVKYGFGNYVDIADRLNDKLRKRGLDIEINKSAIGSLKEPSDRPLGDDYASN